MNVNILGVNVASVTMEGALQRVDSLVAASRPAFIATANAEMLMLASSDLRLASVLNSADLVVPDGAGTVWAARHLGFDMPERVAGVDLVSNLLKRDYSFYFLGAAPGVAERVAAKFNNVVGVRNGFFKPAEVPEIISDINSSGAQILLVGLGVPRQEFWISDNLSSLKRAVCIGVGGTFDVLSGDLPRAPLWIQRARLEWLFRLLIQPSRVSRLAFLPKFILKVAGDKS